MVTESPSRFRIDLFRILTRAILPLAIISIVYGLWAIQPVEMDDWLAIHRHEYFRVPCWPMNGQQIRYCFDGRYLLTTSPFSLFKPWSLLTAIFVVTLIWKSLSFESLFVRAILTLFVALGFPYLGHIGPWNLGASEYTVSAFWTVLWYLVYKKVSVQSKPRILLLPLFIISFIAAAWHESWIVTFSGIIFFLGIDAALAHQKKDPFAKSKLLSFLVIAAAYCLVILFYLHNGTAVIDTRFGNNAGHMRSLFNGPYLISAFSKVMEPLANILKKFIPILLLMFYIKLNKKFSTHLDKHFGLFTFASLGALLFIYLIAFLNFPLIWRVRLLSVYVFAICAFAFPKRHVEHWVHSFGLERYRKALRAILFGLVIALMAHNTFFTYIYNNVDVKGWLQYRKMALTNDPEAMDGLCCRTLLFYRPKIQEVDWSQEWGEQDDEFRFYFGPDFERVKAELAAYRGEK